MKFPNNFSWGTATASHQVEGGCDNNNWYKWESAFNDKGLPELRMGKKLEMHVITGIDIKMILV